MTGTCRESPGFVKDAQFSRIRTCYVAAAINDKTRDAGRRDPPPLSRFARGTRASDGDL